MCVRMYRALVSCPDSAPHLLGLISHLETIAHRQHYVTIQVGSVLGYPGVSQTEMTLIAGKDEVCDADQYQ